MLSPAGPDLLAIDHIVIAIAARDGAQRSCVSAATGFGDAEGLET
jgi:hypothetical protein